MHRPFRGIIWFVVELLHRNSKTPLMARLLSRVRRERAGVSPAQLYVAGLAPGTSHNPSLSATASPVSFVAVKRIWLSYVLFSNKLPDALVQKGVKGRDTKVMV